MAVTITNAGLNLLRDALAVGTVPKITYLAIGTGVQGTPATATRLANEVFRKQITSAPNGANPGETLFNLLLSPQDSVGTAITEYALFGGGATATANSGTMIFYNTYSHTHTGLESIQFTVDSTF